MKSTTHKEQRVKTSGLSLVGMGIQPRHTMICTIPIRIGECIYFQKATLDWGKDVGLLFAEGGQVIRCNIWETYIAKADKALLAQRIVSAAIKHNVL